MVTLMTLVMMTTVPMTIVTKIIKRKTKEEVNDDDIDDDDNDNHEHDNTVCLLTCAGAYPDFCSTKRLGVFLIYYTYLSFT